MPPLPLSEITHIRYQITMPFHQITSGDSEQPKLNLQIDKFEGVNLLVKDARTKPSEAVEALNLYQVEDCAWSPRPGTAQFGSPLPGNEKSIINGATEYVSKKSDTHDEIRQILAVVDGVVYLSRNDASTWSELAGATFDPHEKVRFLQLGGYLYMFNGIDCLTIYDGKKLFCNSRIQEPTNVVATLGSGLTSGNYNQYYRVTAVNDIGETGAVHTTAIATNKERDMWNSDKNECIDLTWNPVEGAISYRIYWGDIQGEERYIAASLTNAYRDNSIGSPNLHIRLPDDNTTGAPVFASAWISDNAIYATNDRFHPYRVYRTGTGEHVKHFSGFFGGFYVDLEDGGREKPRAGRHYQTGSGDGRSTIFCSTPEGHGSVWQITTENATVQDVSFIIPKVYKIIGSVGTDAVDGVINVENDVFFPNKQGVYALGPEKEYFGILRTNNLAALIIEYWRNLPGNKIKDIASYYWSNKVLISVSTDGQKNNRTIIYDRERLRWYVDWSIGFKSFFEFTDRSKTTHLIGIHENGNTLTEISDKIRGDNGAAFKCVYMSGRIPIDKSWNEFGKVKKAYVKLGRPRGAIFFAVYGTQKKKGYAALASRAITSLMSASGIGWDIMGSVLMSDTAGAPTSYSESSEIKYLKINKKVRDIQFRVSSESISAEWTLLGIKAKGFKINTSDPPTWKLKKN